MLHVEMGRYAAYVWPAFGISAVVLIAMVWDSLARAARWRRAAEEAEPPSREPNP